jgi:hypothetical protein
VAIVATETGVVSQTLPQTISAHNQSKEIKMTKNWWKSKTLWTSGIAFLVGLGTAAGVIDADTGLKIEACLAPMIFAFLRIGDKPIG